MCWLSSIHCRMTGSLTANNQDSEMFGFARTRSASVKRDRRTGCIVVKVSWVRLELNVLVSAVTIRRQI